MKKLISILMILAMLLTAAIAETTISTSGTADVIVPADEVHIVFGVVSVSEDAQEAQSQVNENIANVRQALLDSGISEDDINTGTLSLSSYYEYTYDESDRSTYRAYASLVVRSNDMENIGAIIDVGLTSGANELSTVDFICKDTDEAKMQCLGAAYDSARAKAEKLAEVSGMTITGIESITEGYSYSTTSQDSFSAAKAANYTPTNVEAANIDVYCEVTVVFTAE